MSFRLRIIFGIAAIQAVMLVVLIVSNMNYLRQSNEDELRKRARTTATLFAAATRDAVLATDLATLESAVAAVMTNPGVAYARISADGRTLAEGGTSPTPRFRADQKFAELDDGVFAAGADIRVEGVTHGRVEIGLSVAALRSTLDRARTQALSIAFAGMALVALFSYFLGVYLTRKLDALRAGARHLAAGELGFQIDVGGSDELALTARSFNEMSMQLRSTAEERQRAENELGHYKEHLEQLVAARTAELTRSNDELRASHRRLEEAHQQLLQSEKMASIGQLAAGVAHEINNPIGFVVSNMGSLEQYLRDLLRLIDACEAAADSDDPTGHLAAMRAIRDEIDLAFLREDVVNLLAESNDGLQRVRKIVQDLKDFSHVGESAWQIADLHRGLDSTLNMVRNELRYKAELVKEYGPLPEIECLPLELNQVFMNLLVNAGQAIRERGTITLRSGVEADGVWVEVADSGQGIAPENLKRIFDPFFTTKPVGQGTGLGLSLSYGIVKKHHGRIEVVSVVGEGTRFRVHLPLRQPPAASDQ